MKLILSDKNLSHRIGIRALDVALKALRLCVLGGMVCAPRWNQISLTGTNRS